jgi:hypothetical protein
MVVGDETGTLKKQRSQDGGKESRGVQFCWARLKTPITIESNRHRF